MACSNDNLQLKVLRQLITASFIDQVAVRKDRVEKTETSGTQFKSAKGVAYRALGVTEDVFIHPTSVLINGPPPDFVVYHEVVRTGRAYMKGATHRNSSIIHAAHT